MKYTIVKHALRWKSLGFPEDPAKSGVDITDSAHASYTGSQLGVSETYDSKSLAQLACRRMNKSNHSGAYAVCPIRMT